MNKSFVVILVFALAVVGSAKWVTQSKHEYSWEVSKQVADAIKQKLLNNIGDFSDKNFAKMLEQDLKESDDSKRQLKKLTNVSANQLFGILGLADPRCDHDGNGFVQGEELKCLNYAWKAYLPH